MDEMFRDFPLITGAKQWHPLDGEIKNIKGGGKNKLVSICRWYDVDVKFWKYYNTHS